MSLVTTPDDAIHTAHALRAAQQPSRYPDWDAALLEQLGDERIPDDSPLNGQEPVIRLFGGASAW